MSEAALLPVAVDAMGGDNAPGAIVEGALAAAESGIPVILVGDPATFDAGGLEVIEASEVIGMHDDPARGVRQKKDSSLVRAAEAVRDGRASAMLSAGNTGAAMASALFRLKRLPGVARPSIATPIPVPGHQPTIVLDAGANAECNPSWLVQFAQMGTVLSRERYGIERPRVGLLSIGEEETKGNDLVKATHALLASGAGGDDVHFVGNVEGRDIMTPDVDVVVTDGFTGNVVLKTLEGSLRFAMNAVIATCDLNDETRAAGNVLLPALAPIAADLDPDTQGGASLLGVGGVCIISHGSSSPYAITNAIGVAAAAAADGLVELVAKAIASAPTLPADDSRQ